jgi:hypothetical protein
LGVIVRQQLLYKVCAKEELMKRQLSLFLTITVALLSLPGLSLASGARSALRSLLSVALSSVRAPQFYHVGLFLPLDGFSAHWESP